MKLLTCPINGPRPVTEFVYGGPVRAMPDPAACSDADWAAYVFERDGVAAVRREWWYHAASGVWFVAERDTARDEVLRTYLWGQQDIGQQSSGRPSSGPCGGDTT